MPNLPSILINNWPSSVLVNEIVTLACKSQLPRTVFTLQYHKKLSITNKYLCVLIGQLIDYHILDYSEGQLAKSKEKDVDKLIFDFLQLKKFQQESNKKPKRKIRNNRFSSKITQNILSQVNSSNLTSNQENSANSRLSPRKLVTSKNTCSRQQVPLQINKDNILVNVEVMLEEKYREFKNLWNRIPTTSELGITSACDFRKVILKYGGYLQYIFLIEGITEDDLLLEYNQLVQKYGESSSFKLLEEYGIYPVWLYCRCLGTLNMFVKAAQALKTENQKCPLHHSNEQVNLHKGSSLLRKDSSSSEIIEWGVFVKSFEMSVRATNVLISNFCSYEELNKITKDSILTLKNCGRKTANEIIDFVENMPGYKENTPKNILPEQFTVVPDELSLLSLPLFSNKHFTKVDLAQLHHGFQVSTKIADLVLSVRISNVLNILELKTVGEVMFTSRTDLLKQLNFGRKCLNELQDVIRSLCLTERSVSGNSSVESSSIDYTSYESMVSSFIKQCEKKQRNQQLFIKRLCFQEGKVPTLEELGQHFEVSRERARQILKKVAAKLHKKANLKKLSFFWEQLDLIVSWGGGLISLKDLPSALQMEFNWPTAPYSLAIGQLLLLRRPTGTFKEENDLVKVESECLSCDLPLQQLQSFDFESTESFHVQVAAAKLCGHCRNVCPWRKTLTTFHRAFVEHLVSKSDGLLVIYNDVVLPYERWRGKYCGNLEDVASHVLETHGEPLHFREIAKGIRQVNEKFAEISDHNVHSAIMRYNTIEIIGRGTYGLKSWGMGGYRSVSTAIENFIDDMGQPQRKKNILQHLKDEFTELNINASLMKETRFTSIGDGFYDRPLNWQQRSCLGFIKRLPDPVAELANYLVNRNNTSYKLVMAFIFFRSVDEDGTIYLYKLRDMFYNFYLSRHKKGLVVELDTAVMSKIDELSTADIKSKVCPKPLTSFLGSGFFQQFSQNGAKLRLVDSVIVNLQQETVRDTLLLTILKAIDDYFLKISLATVPVAIDHYEVAEPLQNFDHTKSEDEHKCQTPSISIKKKGRSKIKL